MRQRFGFGSNILYVLWVNKMCLISQPNIHHIDSIFSFLSLLQASSILLLFFLSPLLCFYAYRSSFCIVLQRVFTCVFVTLLQLYLVCWNRKLTVTVSIFSLSLSLSIFYSFSRSLFFLIVCTNFSFMVAFNLIELT